MSGELQRLLSGGFGTENILGPSCQSRTTLRPAAGWGQWPGSLCPSVAHRNCTPSLRSEASRRRQCLQYPIGPRAVPYPGIGDRCLPRLPGARLTCQKCWALPAYPQAPGEEPVPHWQWLENLQHPLRMEHESMTYGDTKWAQRSVQELGLRCGLGEEWASDSGSAAWHPSRHDLGLSFLSCEMGMVTVPSTVVVRLQTDDVS